MSIITITSSVGSSLGYVGWLRRLATSVGYVGWLRRLATSVGYVGSHKGLARPGIAAEFFSPGPAPLSPINQSHTAARTYEGVKIVETGRKAWRSAASGAGGGGGGNGGGGDGGGGGKPPTGPPLDLGSSGYTRCRASRVELSPATEMVARTAAGI
jgi:hypothetical protein